jgi:hypothetical protein
MTVRILSANHVTMQMQDSEQQLENLVRELKAASHMTVRILSANHVTMQMQDSEQQLENFVILQIFVSD